MTNRAEVEKLQQDLRIIADNVRTEFGSLNVEQLNWKPTADRWSVAQCLDHLITGNKTYFPILDSIVKGNRKSVFMEQLPLLPSIWGKLLIKSLDPKTTRKLKAPANFEPASSDLPGSIVDQFVEHQSEFASLMDRTKDMDLSRIVITSPAVRWVTYSVLDGYRFLVLHEHRHFQQAQRVMAEGNFPKVIE